MADDPDTERRFDPDDQGVGDLVKLPMDLGRELELTGQTLRDARGDLDEVRALGERILELGERLDGRLERLEPRADQILERADAILDRADRIEGRADRLLERAERIEQIADRLEGRADRLIDRGEAIEQRAADAAEAAGEARSQLEDTTVELERLNRNIELLLGPVNTGIEHVGALGEPVRAAAARLVAVGELLGLGAAVRRVEGALDSDEG